MARPVVDAARIKALRETRGWSQEQLAQISDLSERTIQRLEAGTSVSSLESIKALAAAFDVEFDELTRRNDDIARALPKPAFLRRIRSGDELCDAVAQANMFEHDYDSPNSDEEARDIGAFLQNAQETGEMWTDMGPAIQVEAAHELGKTIVQLEAQGFRVFAGRTIRPFQFSLQEKKEQLQLSVATVLVLRHENPKILNRDEQNEGIMALFQS